MKFWDFIPAKSLVWDPIKKSTGLTDAQMAGIAGLAIAAPYAAPMLAGSGAAGGAATAGAAGTSAAAPAAGAQMAGWGAYAKPAMTAMQGASMAHGLLGSAQQPIQGAQLQNRGSDFSGLLSPDVTMQEAEKRKQQQMAVMQGLLGGYRG